MPSTIGRGAELTVAIVLAVAGTAKLGDLDTTRTAVRRLFNRVDAPGSRVVSAVALCLGVGELAASGLLIVVPSVAIDLVGVALTAGFVVVVRVAHKRGVACGCFSSFSVGAAGPAELRRSVALTMIAVVALAAHVGGESAGSTIGTALAAFALLGALFAVSSDSGPTGLIRMARLAFVGRAVDRAGWHRASPWTRRRIMRTVRAAPATAEVATRAGFRRLEWGRSRVVVRRRDHELVGVVVTKAPNGRLQALWREAGPPAIIGYTSTGVVVPLVESELTSNREETVAQV